MPNHIYGITNCSIKAIQLSRRYNYQGAYPPPGHSQVKKGGGVKTAPFSRASQVQTKAATISSSVKKLHWRGQDTLQILQKSLSLTSRYNSSTSHAFTFVYCASSTIRPKRSHAVLREEAECRRAGSRASLQSGKWRCFSIQKTYWQQAPQKKILFLGRAARNSTGSRPKVESHWRCCHLMLLIDVVAYSSPTGAVSYRRWPTPTDCFVFTCRVRPAVEADCSSLGRSGAGRVSLRLRMPSVAQGRSELASYRWRNYLVLFRSICNKYNTA